MMEIEREEFEKEKNHLNETVSLIRKKISSLGQELYDDDSKILESEPLLILGLRRTSRSNFLSIFLNIS